SDFFNARIEQCRARNGKLFPLPLMFSPWVLCCDEGKFTQCNRNVPRPDWSWDDLTNLICALQKELPVTDILESSGTADRWPIYLMRLGGKIYTGDKEQHRVVFDSPETISALNKLQEFYKLLPEANIGPCALRLCTRQDVLIEHLRGTLRPLPGLPGTSSQTLMAGDLLCVRRTVNDFQTVRKIIGLFLSPEIQNEIGRQKYGIPIRKSAAIASFDENNPQDCLFFSEMLKIEPNQFQIHPEAGRLLNHAMPSFLRGEMTPEAFAAELTPVFRALLKYS
ncbi:MAG: hypothetical protein PHS41_05130, partial [Victivallaceae bacterium]|nr:hypothetical protein [Victivallaceae bacterium]